MGIRNLPERLLGDVSALSAGRTVVIGKLSTGTSFRYIAHKFDSQNKVYFTKLTLQDIFTEFNNNHSNNIMCVYIYIYITICFKFLLIVWKRCMMWIISILRIHDVKKQVFLKMRWILLCDVKRCNARFVFISTFVSSHRIKKHLFKNPIFTLQQHCV